MLLTSIGPTEAKYLLKALAIPLASVKVLPSTVNLFGKDNLPRLELISCLIPFHVAFALSFSLFCSCKFYSESDYFETYLLYNA